MDRLILFLIRHGLTDGNLRKNYVGCGTDESLCIEGRVRLLQARPPSAHFLVLSPMKRCIETAQALYPRLYSEGEFCLEDDLRECDFGLFEGRNYNDMSSDPLYHAWVASGGASGFPGGEKRDEFIARCCRAFSRQVDELFRKEDVAGNPFSVSMIIHGGTIMSILCTFAREKKEYYEWIVENGEGYEVWIDRALWMKRHKFSFEKKMTRPKLRDES